MARRKPDIVANRIEEIEIPDFGINYIIKYDDIYRVVFQALRQPIIIEELPIQGDYHYNFEAILEIGQIWEIVI